ncbi:IclR family transcriptional regulator [Roseibium sp. RKSG952]|uniref:IclR family transcriptional regulator n=1 Tax=Roseibium sp. RKSG952 TaxID=2529384 RepID=UPI0012BD0800|nr:IclR family transcriptional regulator [Roseibium sp. RKSG952]MTH98344.1 IclR family transcriptional regulator [Roseibium sp. RKSG952]
MEKPSDAETTERRTGTVQSVAIAGRFLRILTNAETPLPLGLIARKAGTGSPTAHRYLQSLVKEGLARQDPATGFYDLGPAALDIGAAALKRVQPVELAARVMKDLANGSASSAGVAIWTERGPTLVRWYRSAYFAISSVGLGDVLPIDNSACGYVFQAFLPQGRIEAARAMQPDHFRGNAPDSDRLATIRQTCRAELTDHLLPGIAGQAVPVFDAQQEIVCALTTVTNAGRQSDPSDQNRLVQCGADLARETGGTAAFAAAGLLSADE